MSRTDSSSSGSVRTLITEALARVSTQCVRSYLELDDYGVGMPSSAIRP
jgi:hypothetical protein